MGRGEEHANTGYWKLPGPLEILSSPPAAAIGSPGGAHLNYLSYFLPKGEKNMFLRGVKNYLCICRHTSTGGELLYLPE